MKPPGPAPPTPPPPFVFWPSARVNPGNLGSLKLKLGNQQVECWALACRDRRFQTSGWHCFLQEARLKLVAPTVERGSLKATENGTLIVRLTRAALRPQPFFSRACGVSCSVARSVASLVRTPLRIKLERPHLFLEAIP